MYVSLDLSTRYPGTRNYASKRDVVASDHGLNRDTSLGDGHMSRGDGICWRFGGNGVKMLQYFRRI